MVDVNKPLFALGQVVATPGALERLQQAEVGPSELLSRHACGDFGTVSPADRALNLEAIRTGERVFSAYELPDGETVWVITEADRSSTCCLHPSEY